MLSSTPNQRIGSNNQNHVRRKRRLANSSSARCFATNTPATNPLARKSPSSPTNTRTDPPPGETWTKSKNLECFPSARSSALDVPVEYSATVPFGPTVVVRPPLRSFAAFGENVTEFGTLATIFPQKSLGIRTTRFPPSVLAVRRNR
jgi:hypothetical protein